jgi:ankyrin repeat protein
MTDSNASDTLRQAAEAARKGDLTTLDTLLDKSPGLIHERDDNGETLLHHACRAATGDIAIPRVDGTPEQHRAVGTIIAAGSDLNATTPDGWSPRTFLPSCYRLLLSMTTSGAPLCQRQFETDRP